MHDPPNPLQQRFVPTTSAQRRPPVQQPGADAPGVQRVDSASEHVAAPWQRPDTQSSVPQHPREFAQAPPVVLQQRFVPTTSWHERPPAQQFGAAPPTVHVAASASPQVAGAWQRPETHSRLPQQPDDVVQAPPALLQQRLVPTTSAQERPPAQQFGAAPVAVQAADSPRLHVEVVARQVPDWQVVPAQQSVLAAQVAPAGLQQRPPAQSPSPQQP